MLHITIETIEYIENLNNRSKYTNTLITTWYLPEPLNWRSDSPGTILARLPWRGDTTEVSDLNTNITRYITAQSSNSLAALSSGNPQHGDI